MSKRIAAPISRTRLAGWLIFVTIPATILGGVYLLQDRSYYAVSTLVILQTMLPFFLHFEGRRPQARELVLIAALAGIGVAGRAAFFWLPQFKPVVAIVILVGVTLGAEAGFLTGALAFFVSNFFAGQGPWTPWQMFCGGSIGFLAGLLFKKGWLPKKRLPLCIYGALATYLLYGGLMNLCSVLIFTARPSWQMLLAAYISAVGFDFVHSVATVFFLLLLSGSMIEKIDRIKEKYGLLEP